LNLYFTLEVKVGNARERESSIAARFSKNLQINSLYFKEENLGQPKLSWQGKIVPLIFYCFILTFIFSDLMTILHITKEHYVIMYPSIPPCKQTSCD
jgi:hypothetical protein